MFCTQVYVLYTCYLGATCLAAFMWFCVRITAPQGVAVNLKWTNSVWDSKAATEEHQGDEHTVHDALTHVDVNQQRSLK